jgi:quercetin dioxygenase-like cupin family protein
MSEVIRESHQLQTASWADFDGENLQIYDNEREIQMINSDGTGTPLLKSGEFGADVIRFGAGEGVAEHTHIGKHVLFVLKGQGFLTYDGVKNDLYPELGYLVESQISHAINAGENDALVLLVVGDDHRGLNDPERMELVQE